MEEFYNNYAGSIHEDKIPDYVVAVCAINATLRTEGVLELAGGIQDTISENLLGKKLFFKGYKSRTKYGRHSNRCLCYFTFRCTYKMKKNLSENVMIALKVAR